jgi:hypothetical protein
MSNDLHGLIRPHKGRPMVMLGLLMALWVGARVALVSDWQGARPQEARLDMALAVPAAKVSSRWAGLPPPPSSPRPTPRPRPRLDWDPLPSLMTPLPEAAVSVGVLGERTPSDTPQTTPAEPAVGIQPAKMSRWSGDGWLAVRRGGDHGVASGAGMAPSYGANQIGGVLRYRLDENDPHRISAYLRAYGAMNGSGEAEGAMGVSLRPLPIVPVLALVELRTSQFANGEIHPRPALSLVSQWQPWALGASFEAESYAQAGYVGGRGGTPFVDGQMRLEHLVSEDGGVQMRLGAGAWGGAQQGAGRLDIGPTARFSVWSHGAGGRLALDWRFRVAGRAMPDSGPALTLSAGF